MNHDPKAETLTTLAQQIRAASEAVSSFKQQLSLAVQELGNVIPIYNEQIQEALKRFSLHIEPINLSGWRSTMNNLQQCFFSIRYISLLEKLKWPLFLINDHTLQQDILTACSETIDADAVQKIIFSHCNADFLDALRIDWADCPTLSDARKPILLEALFMHEQCYYYASTSILMCQIYGIAADIASFAKNQGLKLEENDKDSISQQFNIERKHIDNEKGRLIQMIFFAENGQLLWETMVEYLQHEILSSSDSQERWATQPLRNKICHGTQLNFGTKEHSLKAILVIDMLIQLAYEINRTVIDSSVPCDGIEEFSN